MPFFIALMILVAFGLLMVFSASMYSSALSSSRGYNDFLKQAVFVVVGIIVAYGASLFDYRFFERREVAMVAYGAALVCLGLVLTPLGTKVNGAQRWLFFFQPSELAKFAGILYMASLISRKPEILQAPQKDLFLECMVPILLLCGLTAIEPSMTSALTIGVGMAAVLFFAGIKFRRLIPYAAAAGVAIAALLILEPFRLERLKVLVGQGSVDYQITQSLLAIGTGGVFGQGLGNGKQKLLFLPELQNDFIFANIGEEFGLLGCLFVLGLYAFIIWRGFRIANAAPDRFSYLFVSSVMLLLGFQVFVNVGVATQVLPVTGIALPFVSSGGTSTLILFGMMGPILSISRQVQLDSTGKRKEKA